MSKTITIDPVTRVEGHGRVSVHLDDNGKVENAYFHIVEFRGFERFIQGHPYWEAPLLVQRLCGICPVSHHLAAAKAIDQIVGLGPQGLSAYCNQAPSIVALRTSVPVARPALFLSGFSGTCSLGRMLLRRNGM
jgi:hypothetical protein